MKPRKMKDSGIPWIGQIPEGWEVRKIKTIFQVLGGATPTSGNVDYWNGDIPWVTPADMSDDKIYLKNSKRKITREGLESCAAELVPVESIIVSNRAPIGKVALAGVPLCTNQGCKSLRASEAVCSKYFYYYLRTQTETLNMFGQGTTFLELSSQSLNDFPTPYPKRDDQYRIAAYLDEKCGEINRVMAAKERQNEQLCDQRTAVIHEAVTKGLDPKAKFKDSGIEWIGQIPVGWEVRKIKTIFQVLGGATPTSGNVDYWNGDIPWVTPADMSDDKIYLKNSKRKITREGLESCAAELVPVESIIVSNRAPIGKVALAGVPLCTNQGCKSLRASEAVCSKYFYYYLRTQTETLNMFGQGTTFLELSSQSLNDFPTPYPKRDDQYRIAAYLDEKCGEINRVMVANEGMVAKLKEYRSSLIWEAVTGKTCL